MGELGVASIASLTTIAAGAGPVLNIGGEGEVPGAINFQGPWIWGAIYAASATGQTVAQMQAAGNQFVVGSNVALAICTGYVPQRAKTN
jgi:hypothetical protein